jgi:hypothetical protein
MAHLLLSSKDIGQGHPASVVSKKGSSGESVLLTI